MNDGWLALRGSSIDSFPFRMSLTVNCDNREVVLSDFVLMTTDARIDEVQLHSVGGHVVTKVYKYARQVSVGGEI